MMRLFMLLLRMFMMAVVAFWCISCGQLGIDTLTTGGNGNSNTQVGQASVGTMNSQSQAGNTSVQGANVQTMNSNAANDSTAINSANINAMNSSSASGATNVSAMNVGSYQSQGGTGPTNIGSLNVQADVSNWLSGNQYTVFQLMAPVNCSSMATCSCILRFSDPANGIHLNHLGYAENQDYPGAVVLIGPNTPLGQKVACTGIPSKFIGNSQPSDANFFFQDQYVNRTPMRGVASTNDINQLTSIVNQ